MVGARANKKNAIVLMVVLAFLGGNAGCTSLLQAGSGHGVAVMGGVRLTEAIVSDPPVMTGSRYEARFSPIEKVLVVLEFPLTTAFDLLLLPFGIVNEWKFHDGFEVTADDARDPVMCDPIP